ncbi:MAG: transposase [Candidatus Paceibacterota bacterium]
MARKLRDNSGDQYYHIINRANARFNIFRDSSDYQLFENVLMESLRRFEIKLLTHNILYNHFHFVLYVYKDAEISRFMHWLSTVFILRWHQKHQSVGTGHLFQGRYRSFPIKNERHLLQVLIYVDSNAVAAGLVENAQEWRWSAIWIKINGNSEQKKMLAEWPIDVPLDYLYLVNKNKEMGSDPTGLE